MHFLKKFRDYKLIIRTILLKQNIILMSSPLHLLNFIEYKNLDHNKNAELKNEIIFISNSYNQEMSKIMYINKIFNKNQNKLLDINHFFIKIVVLIILNFRKLFFKRINQLIVANYANKYFSRFYKISNRILFIDDGFNIFNEKKDYFFKIKFFFTNINVNYFNNKNNYLQNKFIFLKKRINKNIKIKKIILIVGTPDAETNYLDKKLYHNFLHKISKIYSGNKIYYFPHPRESYQKCKEYNFFSTIKSKLPLELFLISKNIFPELIIGFNTACFQTLRMLFGFKINLLNYQYILKASEEKNNLNIGFIKEKKKIKKIQNYIKKYLSIDTKFIYLNQ